MTHDPHAHDSLDPRARMVDAIRSAIDGTDQPERILILTARLAAFGVDRPYCEWPSSISRDQARELPSRLEARCLEVVRALDRSQGDELFSALVEAQDLHCLHVIDRRHGDLLALAHPAFEALHHVSGRALPDDQAAFMIEETADQRRCDLMDSDCVLPVMLHPLGASALAAVAFESSGREPMPVVEVTPLPVFEDELVFDGGRPSQRMIRRFAERCGLIRCQDGSECSVRAVLEEDWRISIEFNGPEAWCRRIDRVRLGSRTAVPDDDRRDFWSTSLHALGLDAQTRLVGQPIVVALTNGERFSL